MSPTKTPLINLISLRKQYIRARMGLETEKHGTICAWLVDTMPEGIGLDERNMRFDALYGHFEAEGYKVNRAKDGLMTNALFPMEEWLPRVILMDRIIRRVEHQILNEAYPDVGIEDILG